MAESKPKVGDAVMIDGQELTVSAVEPGGKPVVKFGDADALACAGLIADIRKKHGGPIAEIQAAMKEAQKIELRSERKLEVLKLSVKADKLDNVLIAEMEKIPRGTTTSVNLRDIEWVTAGNCWTVRGRLLSYKDRQRAKGRVV